MGGGGRFPNFAVAMTLPERGAEQTDFAAGQLRERLCAGISHDRAVTSS